GLAGGVSGRLPDRAPHLLGFTGDPGKDGRDGRREPPRRAPRGAASDADQPRGRPAALTSVRVGQGPAALRKSRARPQRRPRTAISTANAATTRMAAAAIDDSRSPDWNSP